MAIKRKRRASPSAKGLAVGEQLRRSTLLGHAPLPWAWVGTEVLEPANITNEHLLLTCGLSKKNKFPFCCNKYSPKLAGSSKFPLKNGDNATSLDGELASDTIVISDDEASDCSKRYCKSNPNCLNYLGQDIWEDEGTAWESYAQASKLGDNPMLESRDPELPVGLKNLGATCYANAFIQVWFRDLAFRRGVYQCQPGKDLDEKYKDSPIFQLQVTFAALQESTQNVFNPTKLVESLQLRTAEQQDAQEFSKLFMSHLDAEFKKQTDQTLQSLLTDQFEGTQIYGTICHSCKYRSERESKFREIEINFEGNSSLEDRIGALLDHEKLTGDNQYLCSHCETLQDATRYTELRRLPPVLHFSLLRFVYDLESMERKKSKHAISFPMSLNMAQFLQNPEAGPNTASEMATYQLRGVLLHKGPSAYHGHYEAQVYDTTNQSWYQFNDELVTKIKDLGDKPAARKGAGEDHKKPSGSKGSNSKKRRRIEDSEDDNSESGQLTSQKAGRNDSRSTSSKDAYMLIYVRSDQDAAIRPPLPPAQALEYVKDLNTSHDQACESYSMKEHEIKTKFQDLQQKVQSIYRAWNASNDSEPSVIASAKALKTWLSDQCIAANKLKTFPTASSSTDITTDGFVNGCSLSSPAASDVPRVGHDFHSISVDDIVCSHNRLNPLKSANMKRITRTAYDRIRNETKCSFEPELSPSDVCLDCVQASFDERLYQVEHPRLVSRVDKSNGSDEEPGYWISKQWLRDWRLAKPKMHVVSQPDPSPDSPEFYGHVRCEHNGLTSSATNRTRISLEAYLILKELFPSWDAVSADSEVCPICDVMAHTSKEHKLAFRKQAEDEKARLKHMYDNALNGNLSLLENVRCAIVPAQFMKAWRKWIARPADSDRPESIDNSFLLCKHSKLVIDPSSSVDMGSALSVIKLSDWEVLENLYPVGPLIAVENRVVEGEALPRLVSDLDVCTDCRRERRTLWDTTELTIRVCRSDGEVQVGSVTEDPKPLVTYGSRASGARQSRRLRQAKECGEKRKLLVSKTSTVKDVKVMIQSELKIPTICQRLFYQDKELDNNVVTVATLGILANDILDLREENEVHDLDSDLEQGSTRTKPREEGLGFGGTLLGSSQQSSSRENTPLGAPLAAKSCPQCTFSNKADANACSICDFPFE